MESFQIFEDINLVRVEYEFVALEGRVFDVLEGVYAFRWLCAHNEDRYREQKGRESL